MIFRKSVPKQMVVIVLLAVLCSYAQPAKIRIACIGNSITWGGLGDLSYPQQLQKKLGSNYDVRNYGISARTLLKKGDYPYWKELEFIDARNFDPHIVIIKLGTNDSKPQNWIYKDEFFSNYTEFVAAFRMLKRRPQIYVCFPVPVFHTNWGINNPVVKDEIIPLIDSVRNSAQTFLIDFYSLMKNDSALFPDGVHPNAIGYEKMAQLVYDTVMHGQSGVIRYFYATRDTLNKNETAILYWNTSENSQVFLNGNPVNAVDSLNIAPSNTTTYTLTTRGSISDSVTRTIFYYPPGKIKFFRANIPMYEIGSIDSIALRWQTGTGSSVSFNGTPVKENDTVGVFVSRDTIFTLIADGEQADTQSITITGIQTDKFNRALHRTASASTTDWGYSISAVNDGDSNTFWKSKSGKTQWISIDFGKTISVKNVRLQWGSVYGISYYLYLVKESGELIAIYNTGAGDGDVDDISGLSGSGRQLKILCLKNNTLDDSYILKECEVYGTNDLTSARDNNSTLSVSTFLLEQNYPNPFNPSTIINYRIPSTAHVTVTIFDLLGKKVTTLVDETKPAGNYSILFNAERLPNGVYFVRLQSGVMMQTKTMVFLK